MQDSLGTLVRKARMAYDKRILMQVLYNNLELQYHLKIRRESYDHSDPKAISASALRLDRLRRAHATRPPSAAVDLAKVQNRRENSGGIKFEDEMIEAQGKSVSNEFEGVHVRDAFQHAENWQMLSFVRLVESVADVMSHHLKRSEFSALELGCGGGAIFNTLRYVGVSDYIGVDINSSALESSQIVQDNKAHFRALNLQQEIDFGRKFDCVCSFETFEHIKEEHSDEAIRTIANHMGENSLFVGTISKVAGIYHINAHEKDWWMKKFNANGLGHKGKHADYEELIARSYPFNWHPRYSSVFVLGKL
ncbi:MAG: class I SAM-dependent methyltransferase [Bdellovibrionota bacterium]